MKRIYRSRTRHIITVESCAVARALDFVAATVRSAQGPVRRTKSQGRADRPAPAPAASIRAPRWLAHADQRRHIGLDQASDAEEQLAAKVRA